MKVNENSHALGIYVHIPFCVQKCQYCDFLSFPASRETQRRYLTALHKEIQDAAKNVRSCREGKQKQGEENPPEKLADNPSEPWKVVSIFFGGGTPSLLEAQEIPGLLHEIRSGFWVCDDAEITVECNPGTLTMEKLLAWREAGVNRLSIGVQSARDEELNLLGRIHTWESFLEGYQMAREAGFTNINLDLMSALPGQNISSWEETLQQALSLRPEHISAYSLIIEEGTPFYQRYHEADQKRERGEAQALLPSEEEERRMYDKTKELLARHGMHRYEISNYCLPGRECVHNVGYWERRDYLGFGLGAASLFRETRWKNTGDLLKYLSAEAGTRMGVDAFDTNARDNHSCAEPNHEEILQHLTAQEQMEETMFLGLRMMTGLNADAFAHMFGTTLDAVYGEVIQKHQAQGLVSFEKGSLRLTDRGIDVSNYVLSDYLLT